MGCARTKDAIDELAQAYPSHEFRVANVASDLEVRLWAEHVVREHGPPDFVLNNAAVLNCGSPLWALNAQDCSDAIDTNLKGVFNVIRHFAPSMMQRRKGVIVNFSSRWATHFQRYMGPYCATKWAVVALTRVLAEELRPHDVTVVGLNPGVVQTPMFEQYARFMTTSRTPDYPTAEAWGRHAVPYILQLRMKDTGRLRVIPTTTHTHMPGATQ